MTERNPAKGSMPVNSGDSESLSVSCIVRCRIKKYIMFILNIILTLTVIFFLADDKDPYEKYTTESKNGSK